MAVWAKKERQMAITTCVFDAYGTLFDVAAAAVHVAAAIVNAVAASDWGQRRGAAPGVVAAQRHCADARGEHAIQPRPGQPDGACGGTTAAPLLVLRPGNGAAASRSCPFRVAPIL